MGEHFSWSERITSPLIFLATLAPRTERIVFGTGVLNLPQLHPATVARYAAMFDQLCRGRFIMGIGPGGLVSDFELFEVGQAELRPQMMLESIDAILKLWAEDPPYEIPGPVLEHLARAPRVSRVRGRPRSAAIPAAPSARSRSRSSRRTRRAPRTAGERGWIPSPGSSFIAATSVATGRNTPRGARPPAGGPIPTSGASREACSSRRPTRRPRTTSPTPRAGSRTTTGGSVSSSDSPQGAVHGEGPAGDAGRGRHRGRDQARLIIAGGPRRVVDQLVALATRWVTSGRCSWPVTTGISRRSGALDGAPGDRGDAAVRASRGGDPTGLRQFRRADPPAAEPSAAQPPGSPARG